MCWFVESLLTRAQIYCMSFSLTPEISQFIWHSYKYRQHSDFWYLTGFEEANSAVIFKKTSNSLGYRMTMFSQGKDPHREKWEGAR
jgi:Xaa-Pro aminopeptidase